MALKVDIVTPTSLVYSGEAAEVRLPGWRGEFGVLPDHEDYLALTRPGLLTLVKTTGADDKYVVGPGFAEAGASGVTILVDFCESTEGLDKAEAQQEYAEAEATLARSAAGTSEWDAAEEQLALAMAKLRA